MRHSVKYLFQGKWVVILAMLSLFMLVLAACGPNGAGQGGGATPTAVQVQKCGRVTIGPRGAPVDPTASQAAGNCLWQAYQQCQPATMTFTATSLDTGTIRIFTIGKNGSNCMISDVVQHYIAPNPPKTTATYTCAAVTKTSTGLRFASCGQDGTNGTVLVPIA